MSNVVVFLGNFFLLLSFSSAILLPQTFIYLYFILIFTVTATFSLSNASFFFVCIQRTTLFFFQKFPSLFFTSRICRVILVLLLFSLNGYEAHD